MPPLTRATGSGLLPLLRHYLVNKKIDAAIYLIIFIFKNIHSGDLSKTYTGSPCPQQYTSQNAVVRLRFESDGDQNYEGFFATYKRKSNKIIVFATND